jgi:hypothetical protein
VWFENPTISTSDGGSFFTGCIGRVVGLILIVYTAAAVVLFLQSTSALQMQLFVCLTRTKAQLAHSPLRALVHAGGEAVTAVESLQVVSTALLTRQSLREELIVLSCFAVEILRRTKSGETDDVMALYGLAAYLRERHRELRRSLGG